MTNITFIGNNIIDFSTFFLFQNVQFLYLFNITIIRTTQLQGYYSIRDLYDIKVNQNYLSLNLFNILGSFQTTIEGVVIQHNQNTQFLSYLNSFDDFDKVVTLKFEAIYLVDILITDNFNTESFLSTLDIQSSFCSISNAQFLRNYCPLCYRGSSLVIYNTAQLQLDNVFMYDNLALMGGAIYLSQIYSINIQNSIFSSNTALSFGGALYFDYIFNLTFSNTTITQNNADIGGGIYYYSFFPKLFSNLDISNNTANIYGKNVGSFPQKIQVCNLNNSNLQVQNQSNSTSYINNNNNNNLRRNIEELYEIDSKSENQGIINGTVSFDNFRSGDVLNLAIKMLDEEGNEIYLAKDNSYYNEQSNKLLNTFFIQVISEDNESLKISGLNQILIKNASPEDKLWHFNDLKITGYPNTQGKLFRIIMGQMKQYDQYNYLEDKSFLITDFPSYELQAKINFRHCVRGEIYNCDDDQQLCTCTPCSQGYYSLQVFYNASQGQICTICPESAFSCQRDQILLKQGYWRIQNDTDDIIQCINSPDNCRGDSENQTFSGNSMCIPGHTGPLCEVCDTYGQFWGEPYMRLNNFKCIPCQNLNNFVSVLPFLLIFFVMVFYIIFSIKVTIQLSKGFMYSYYFRKLGMLHIGPSSTNNQAQFYVKQFMHYLQIAVIVNDHDFNVPYVTDYLPQLISSPIKNTQYSFDCIFAKMGNVVPVVYLRSAWSLIIPFYYVITIAIIYLSIYIMKKTLKHSQFFIYNGLLFLLVLFQPGIVSSLFSVISCRQIGGKFYIFADIAHECYTKEYYQYILILILPGIILWGVLIPLFILKKIRENQSKLDEFHMRLKFGFLYIDYSRKHCYWEFVKIYEKVIIMVLSNMLDELFYTKSILICAIIISYYIFSVKRQPYYIQNYNTLDQRITILTFILILLNIFLYSRESSSLYDFFYFICVLLHNSILFFLLFKFLIAKIKTRYRSFIYKLLLHLKQLLPLLFQFIKLHPPINSLRSSANWQKVQVAKDIIIKYRQNGFHFSTIEQLRRPYQKYMHELKEDVISAISSRRSSIKIVTLSTKLHPTVAQLKNKNKKKVNISIPSYDSTHIISQNQVNSFEENNDFRINKLNKIKKSPSTAPKYSSTNSQQPSLQIINDQYYQKSLKMSDISPIKNSNSILSLKQSPHYYQKQSNVISLSKFEDNLSSQQHLQIYSQPQSPSLSQFVTTKEKKNSQSCNKSNNNIFQSSQLQNSLYQTNSMQKSTYNNSINSFHEDSNLLLFNSGCNLSPIKIKETDYKKHLSQVQQIQNNDQQTPTKTNSPSSQEISQKRQNLLLCLSSPTSESNSSQSSNLSSNQSKKNEQISGIDEFVQESSPITAKSKTVNTLFQPKKLDLEIQLQSFSPKALSSPHFQMKDSISYPSQGTGIDQNQEMIDTQNSKGQRDQKQVPYKFITQMKQNMKDSLFSFQPQDLFSVSSLKKGNKQSSSFPLLPLQRQISPIKVSTLNGIKFNYEKQGINSDTENEFIDQEEQENKIIDLNQDQNKKKSVSLCQMSQPNPSITTFSLPNCTQQMQQPIQSQIKDVLQNNDVKCIKQNEEINDSLTDDAKEEYQNN